jgi:hypothetical protein
MENQYELVAQAETARRLTDLQWQILKCLRDKGPGLLLEVSVRVMKFPEDVQEPLRQLQAERLVTTQAVAGVQFGAELFSLTPLGERVLRLMNDPLLRAAQREQTSAPEPALAARKQEMELLNKLGDLARDKGNLEEAADFYKQALGITRELSAGGNTP